MSLTGTNTVHPSNRKTQTRANQLRSVGHAMMLDHQDSTALDRARRCAEQGLQALWHASPQRFTKGRTRAERLIFILHEYEEMTFEEIGLTLDVTADEIFGMHTKVLQEIQIPGPRDLYTPELIQQMKTILDDLESLGGSE